MGPQPVHLDGITLEGGGQLLRLALSLSSLARLPIEVSHIRGKRGPKSEPEKGGGIKPAHLAGAQWLARATDAHTEGLNIGSMQLLFSPPATSSGPAGFESVSPPVWRDIFEEDDLVRRETSISMATPGSIALILQTILPHLLFGQSSAPSRVRIEGGTNVFKSPSIDYVIKVLLPLLSDRLQMPRVRPAIQRRGWSIGRSEIGCVTFDVTPLISQSLPAFQIARRGLVTQISVTLLASGTDTRIAMKNQIIAQIQNWLPAADIAFETEEDSGNAKRLYLLLVAVTESGCRLGSDWLFERKTGRARGKRKNIDSAALAEQAKEVVSKVVMNLQTELAHEGCVDTFMQDQLVVFQALAKGKSTIYTGSLQPTLHTQTARWVAHRLLGVDFDDQGCCKGVGYGQAHQCPPASEATQADASLAKNLQQLDLDLESSG